MFAKSSIDSQEYGLYSSLVGKGGVWGLCVVVSTDGTATIFAVI